MRRILGQAFSSCAPTRACWVGVCLALWACAPHAPTVPPKSAVTRAAAPGPSDPYLAGPLPFDARVHTGQLANGLRYFVLQHPKPVARAQLWLAVNAGSVLEDDDQRGLAHFVEHMAFNGTRKFARMEIVNYLERIGMRFGPDINAYTSFDQTIYQLTLPSDSDEIMNQGLDILHEWASAVAFDAQELAKERGVVLEEWRLGRGAWARIQDKQFGVLFQGSRYATRMPIGLPAIIKGAPREAIMRFYRDWYRPNLMAVVAVGDFDVASVKAAIQTRFADLVNPPDAPERPVISVEAHEQTLVSIETDPEMPTTSVTIYNKFPQRGESTHGDYRRFVGDQLYHQMLNARLSDLGQQPDAPFLFASSSTSAVSRTTEAFVRAAQVKEDGALAGLAALFAEMLRAERHGFSQAELDRAKKNVLRTYEQTVSERNKTDGQQLAAELVRHFLEHEPVPGIEYELDIVKKVLPTFTLAELNHWAQAWAGSANRVILIEGPAKMPGITRAQVLATIWRVQNSEIAAHEERTITRPLLASAPVPGQIVAEKQIRELGVTEWTLSNGVKVVFKATSFQNDEVRFVSFSPGGTSLASDADFVSADFAGAVVNEGGVADLSLIDLDHLLAGKVVDVDVSIDELEENVSGHASPEDLEAMFQLIYLRFTQPRLDKVAFETWRRRQMEWTKNRRAVPETGFFEDMQAFLYNKHPRRRPMTPELLAEIDPDKALAIYRDRLADASDFTFVFVGNIDTPRLRRLVSTYLGALPSTHRTESWRDIGLHLPKGRKDFTVESGREPKGLVYLVFHGPQKWSRDDANDMRMLTEALNIRLREVMREDMSGVYNVAIWGDISRRPRQNRYLTVSFGCDPQNIDALKKAVFEVVAAVKKKGVGPDYIAKLKQQRIRARETAVQENDFWLGELADAYRYGSDPKEILDFQPWIDKISSERIQAAARRFSPTNQYILGVLKPGPADAPRAGNANVPAAKPSSPAQQKTRAPASAL